MKQLKTLIADVDELFKGGTEVPEELFKSFGDAVAAMARDRFKEFGKPRGRNLRLSMIGQPDCKIWHHCNNSPKPELDAYVLRKFMFGDLTEEFLIFLLKAAGHKVEDEQKVIKVAGVVGHQDCLIDGEKVDIKSASSFGFNKFRQNRLLEDDPFGYVAQISAYTKGEEGYEDADGHFLVMDKQHGHLTISTIPNEDLIDPVARIEHLKVLITEPEAPRCFEAEPDGLSGNMKLGTQCGYCDYKDTCWSDANNGEGLRTFLYSGKPRFLTTVVKEPRVEEVIW